MSVELLVRILVSSSLLALAGLAAEKALGSMDRPARATWVVALLATAAVTALLVHGGTLPLRGPTVLDEVVVMFGSATTPAADAGSGGVGAGLVAAWAALALLLVGGTAALAWRQHRRLRSAHVRTIAGRRVLVTDRIGPAVVGLVHPRIVVPAWVLDLSPREQRLVVRHEAEHAAAGDHHVALIGLLLCCLLPWNPLLWYQLRRLRLALEVDCDRRVMRKEPADHVHYGLLLIDVAQRLGRGTPLATALAFPRSFLERRIRMIIHPSRRPVYALAWTLAAVGLLAAACSDTADPIASDSLTASESARSLLVGPLAEPTAGTFRVREPAQAAAPVIERTEGGTATFRMQVGEHEASITGNQLVRLQVRVDEEGRATDVRFAPATPDPLQLRARRALESVRFRREAGDDPDAWIPAVVALR